MAITLVVAHLVVVVATAVQEAALLHAQVVHVLVLLAAVVVLLHLDLVLVLDHHLAVAEAIAALVVEVENKIALLSN